MSALSHQEHEHHNTDVEYFDPNETLITTLRRAISNKQDLLIEQGEDEAIILLGARGECFPHISDEKDFFSAPADKVKITVFAKNDNRIPPVDSIGDNLEELMWKAAFYPSRGRLMQGCNPVDIIELSAWPNLTRLPHTVNSPRIAALLSHHPTSMVFAARVLKITPSEIYQFYSAARCAGLAKPINSTTEEPRLEPHRHQSLLTILLHKLSRL